MSFVRQTPTLIHASHSVIVSPDGSGTLPVELLAEYAVICLMEPDPARPFIARLEAKLGVTDGHRRALHTIGGHKLTDTICPADEALTWHVLRAATRQEGKAEAGLVEAGYAVYVPRLTRWRHTGTEKKRIDQALFGGYLFVGIGEGQSLYEVLQVHGIHNVIRFSPEAHPRPLPFRLIAEIVGCEQRGDFDKTRRDKRRDPPEGAEIQITGGPYQGFPAKFVHRTGDERVRLLFQMMGKWHPMTLKPENVGGLDGEERAA